MFFVFFTFPKLGPNILHVYSFMSTLVSLISPLYQRTDITRGLEHARWHPETRAVVTDYHVRMERRVKLLVRAAAKGYKCKQLCARLCKLH